MCDTLQFGWCPVCGHRRLSAEGYAGGMVVFACGFCGVQLKSDCPMTKFLSILSLYRSEAKPILVDEKIADRNSDAVLATENYPSNLVTKRKRV